MLPYSGEEEYNYVKDASISTWCTLCRNNQDLKDISVPSSQTWEWKVPFCKCRRFIFRTCIWQEQEIWEKEHNILIYVTICNMSHTWGSVKGRLPLYTKLHLGTCGGQATFTYGAGRYHNIEQPFSKPHLFLQTCFILWVKNEKSRYANSLCAFIFVEIQRK